MDSPHLQPGQYHRQRHRHEKHHRQGRREHQQHHKGASHRQQAGADLQQVRGEGGVDSIHVVADAADQITGGMGVKILNRQFAHALEGRLPQIIGHGLTHLDQLGGHHVVHNCRQGAAAQHPGAVAQHTGNVYASRRRAHGVQRPAGQQRYRQNQQIGRHHQHRDPRQGQ